MLFQVKNTLERMLNALLPLIFVVRKKTKEVQASVDNNLLSAPPPQATTEEHDRGWEESLL